MLISLARNTKDTRLTREQCVSLFPHHRGTENTERVLFCPIGRRRSGKKSQPFGSLCDEVARAFSWPSRHIALLRIRRAFSLAVVSRPGKNSFPLWPQCLRGGFIFLVLAFVCIGCAPRHGARISSGTSGALFPPHVRLPEVGQEWWAGHDNQETIPFALLEVPSNPKKGDGGSGGADLDVFLEEDAEEEVVQVSDPLYHWNRAMFHFNDKLYFWALKPLAKGYKAVVPGPARSGVKNFFHNITMPIRMVSCLLQGKGRAASAELTAFLINSTAGVLGFSNPAQRWDELNASEEDLGQTLGTYGIGNGFYIVWPLLGPSTLRDSVGMVGDWFLNPVSYMEPTETYVGVRALDTVNSTSFRIGDYESLKEAAIDPYVALRNAYIQNRKKKTEE